MSKVAIDALSEALLSGSLKVVDLTVTLDAATPTLQLPEEFGWGKSWPFSKELISRYDEKGPFWYWNNFKCGEHTGTHFDAPIHWVTGKDHEDHATDTLPTDKFVGPAVVLDATEQVKSNSDYLLSLDFIHSGSRTWRDTRRCLGPVSYRLVKESDPRRISQYERRWRPHSRMGSRGCGISRWKKGTLSVLEQKPLVLTLVKLLRKNQVSLP